MLKIFGRSHFQTILCPKLKSSESFSIDVSDSECVDASSVLFQDVADPLFAHCRLHADKRTTASRVMHTLCLLQLLHSAW